MPAFKAGDFAGGLNAAVDRLGALIAGEKLPAPSARTAPARRGGALGFDWQDIAIFLFVGVPILGRILSSVMGRKLGALGTGAAVGAIGWFLTASLLVAAGAGIVALFLVGVMGAGSSARRLRRAGDLGWRRRLRRRRLRRRQQRRLRLGRRRQLRRRRRLGAVVMAHWISRLLKHRLVDEDDARRLLGADALTRIEERVAASEKRHSGEIRVVVEAGLPISYLRRGATPRDRAVALFGKLGVWDTERNNGVLIYLLLAERAIEIVADRGLNRHRSGGRMGGDRGVDAERVPGAATSRPACCVPIDAVDALLVRHFAAQPGDVDVNELPDAPLLR